MHLRYAERLARASDSVWQRHYKGMERVWSVGEYAERLDYAKAAKHDVLGWIYFNEGRLADAERELKRALELSKNHVGAHYHLGRLAEARGRLAEAEQLYGKGFQFESGGWSGRKNAEALKRLYAAKHGSLDGLDAYVERLKEEDRARRKKKIAESRVVDAEPMPSFSLERLGGGPKVSSEELKGKIGVINFWGVWCGPCVKEIPDIQKFHEKFKGDTSVVFLTIDHNDPSAETVKEFMAKKKVDFPVLVDDGYVKEKAKVTAFPPTWFMDRRVRIAFKHVGASDVVLEEFIWRVEMLKAEDTRATP